MVRYYGPHVRQPVNTSRTYDPYSYSVQSLDSNQCLFRKYYAHDSGYCVVWRDERRKLHCWQQLLPFAFCSERNVENHRHAGYNVEVIAASPILSSESWSLRTSRSTSPCSNGQGELPVIILNFRTAVRTASAYRAAYTRTRNQKRFTISKMAADWHELMIPRRITRPPIARASEQLDPRSSMQTCHRPNQPHEAFIP